MELTVQYTFGREVKNCDNANEEREPYKYIDKLNLDEEELDKLLFAVGFSFMERTFSKSVDPYFGTEMCNALCEYNPELQQDRTYFKEKSELYTYFSKLQKKNRLEGIGIFYKHPFTNYLRGSNIDFFRNFNGRFMDYRITHIVIIAFMREAFEKALTNQEHLTKNAVEKIRKVENKKLDLNESYDLVFTVLADILHCPIKFWRIDGPIEKDDKYRYTVSSYGTDILFRSHLAFLKMNIMDDNKLLILYEEALNNEMGFNPTSEELENLRNCNMKRKPKLGTNNYLDYCIDRCKKVSEKPEEITSLLEEIETYSKVLDDKMDIEEFRKFIVDVHTTIPPSVFESEGDKNNEPKCMNSECKARDNLIKFECGNCYICQKHGEE